MNNNLKLELVDPTTVSEGDRVFGGDFLVSAVRQTKKTVFITGTWGTGAVETVAHPKMAKISRLASKES